MTLTPAQKITARLQAANAQTEELKLEEARALCLAPYKAKAERMRSAGPTKDCEEISRHVTRIYAGLKPQEPRVELIPAEFYDNQSVNTLKIKDDGTPDFYVGGNYGWRPAQLKTPHDIVLCWKDQETQVSKWRSVPNGKRTLHVGGYTKSDAAASFQTLKGGDMKYYEIAMTISRCIRAADQKAQTEAAIAQHQSSVARVTEATGLKHYGQVSVKATESAEKPIFMTIRVEKAMSVESAIELARVLKEFGIE